MRSTNCFKVLTSIILVMALFVSSCKKAEEAIETVTEEEAVEAVENSISSESGGLIQQIEESTDMVNSITSGKNEICGMSYDSTINLVNPTGTVITYSYNFNWEWMVKCNQSQIPSSVVFSYNMEGGYNAPRMSSDGNATQSFELSGLDLSFDYWIYNGSYEREGTCKSKIGQQTTFSSNIVFEAIDVKVDKVTGNILSGTANIAFSAKTSNGKTFSYDGVITFTGGDTATLVFENEFVIQL